MPDMSSIISELTKKYGEGTIKLANEMPEITVFPTGIPTWDIDLGGGLLVGRTNMIVGRESTGKTSIAYHIGGRYQNLYDIPVYWIDAEKSFDPIRAAQFGFDTSKCIVFGEGIELTAETAFGLVRDLIRSVKEQKDPRALFIVDSIATIVSERVMEKAATEQFGGSALMINQMLNVWNTVLGRTQTLLLINQLRTNMNPMGDPDVLPGGKAQLYISSTITSFRGGELIKDGAIVIGQAFKWTVKKSRKSSPKEIGQINFLYDSGYEIQDNLIQAALEMEILEQGGGGYFVLPGGEKIRGKDKFMEKLKNDSDFLKQLEKLVYEKMPTKLWDGQ